METLDKVNKAVESYNSDRGSMTANQIAELRADLSSNLYLFARDYKEIEKDFGFAKIQLEKIEGEIFLEKFSFYKEGKNSQSVAEVLARKTLKGDPRYIEIAEKVASGEADVKYCDKIFRIGAHVLNSMAYQKA